MLSGENKLHIKQKENNLSKQLKNAVRNLFYSSETDAPVELFTGTVTDAVTHENLLSQIGKADNTPLEMKNFDEFFAKLTAIQDWFGDEEKSTAEKFTNLRDLLKKNLKDLNVFKVGSVEIEIFVVGLDNESRLLGIKTKSVET